MSGDPRSRVLLQIVTELTGLEQDIARLFAASAGTSHRSYLGVLHRDVGLMANQHIDALNAYSENDERRGEDTGPPVSGEKLDEMLGLRREPVGALEELQVDLAALSLISGRYATLCEMAFRLYDPELREIGPRHFGDYSSAIRTVIQLIPAVTAMELADVGLGCHCVCPMCTIGACGCVAVATSIVGEAWAGDATEPDSSGFPLLAPRAGSQLAEAGIEGGDRLVAVDGVAVNSFQEVQDAIRKHQLGEEVRFSIERNGGQPNVIRVRHVHDY